MSDFIQMYLNRISVPPGELYVLIKNYLLSEKDRRLWGFPLHDKYHPDKVVRFFCPGFDNSPDPRTQLCRCGKLLSLLEEDWFVDEAGCDYHWGKRSYDGVQGQGCYSCCKSSSKADGCTHHKYHACGYKPMKSDCFVSTQQATHQNENSGNVFALDCEMVYTTAGLEVARVSLVTLQGDTAYDSLVQPPNTILDYNTAFSGIQPEDLSDVTTTVADARASILKLLNKDSILIGHGLENDLVGLHLLHESLIDTSILYLHESGFPYRYSLKALAEKYLRKIIPGHDSVEDAKTCIALMLQKLDFDIYPFDNPLKKSNFYKRRIPRRLFNSLQNPFQSNYYSRSLSYCNNPVIFIPRIVQLKFPSFLTPRPFPVTHCPQVTLSLCQY